MAKIQALNPSAYQKAAWCNDPLDESNLMPGGVMLDAAQFVADPTTGKKSAESGLLIGRTIAERTAGAAFGPADAADDEIFILAFGVYDIATDPGAVLVRKNTRIWEDKLPNWATVAAAIKTKIQAAYQCQIKGNA